MCENRAILSSYINWEVLYSVGRPFANLDRAAASNYQKSNTYVESCNGAVSIPTSNVGKACHLIRSLPRQVSRAILKIIRHLK